MKTLGKDFQYDLVGQLRNETWIATGGTIINDVFTFTYDAVGNQLMAVNSSGAYTMQYDVPVRIVVAVVAKLTPRAAWCRL